MPKGKELDLAVVFGGPKGKPADPEVEGEEAVSEDDDGVSPAFEAAITEAFPDMAESPERMAAMKRAIKECMESY